MIVTCQICGNNFEADRRNAKNCSDECRKEDGRRRMRRLRKENPEFYRQQYQEWYEQRGIEYHKQWREKHPEWQEGANARSAKRFKEHPELKKAYDAAYYQRHKEQVKASVKSYQQENKDALRPAKHASLVRYRAKLAGAEGNWTAKQFKELCEQTDNRCWYCHIQPDKLTADHMQPVSRGGSNDISNIAPACGPCNYAKRDKTVLEFMQYLRKRNNF